MIYLCDEKIGTNYFGGPLVIMSESETLTVKLMNNLVNTDGKIIDFDEVKNELKLQYPDLVVLGKQLRNKSREYAHTNDVIIETVYYGRNPNHIVSSPIMYTASYIYKCKYDYNAGEYTFESLKHRHDMTGGITTISDLEYKLKLLVK
jgi:hypothetical protein